MSDVYGQGTQEEWETGLKIAFAPADDVGHHGESRMRKRGESARCITRVNPDGTSDAFNRDGTSKSKCQ